MECVRCHNKDPLYFYRDKDVYYCRKCVGFGRLNVGEHPSKNNYSIFQKQTKYTLEYDLTKYQKEVVLKVNANLKKHRDVLVYAGTGCGKTEIVMQSIENYLNAHKKVGIAISRRQVVLEIKERMQKAFSNIHVIAVCEGFTDEVDGDLIVCTMHQLYRYHQSFDLLIMDEVDAFPYSGNEVLEAIAKHACKGEIIYLSATPEARMLNDAQIETIFLFQRPHGFPFVVPKCICIPFWIQICILFIVLKKQEKTKKQTLVFVPTIKMANMLNYIFSRFFKCDVCTSKTPEKDEVLQKLRDKQISLLFCTTVLERGITIAGVDVIVVNAQHMVFSEASLIQICGRVGRSFTQPSGMCLLLCEQKSEAMKKCMQTLIWMNQNAQTTL